ncbi:MAG: type II toxin-antitoxin system HicA family toxin [Alphaproteobacteria bacterium]|nr:type II toxin-antitoxin system HicA family toxin [Alphaproteobacteria bacterium]
MDIHRQLRDLLEEAGCYYDRPGKGSHEVWYSPITKRRFPVPYRGHLKDRNLANEILKQAGLPKHF